MTENKTLFNNAIDKKKLWHLIQSVLTEINKDYIAHGHRVATMMLKLANYQNIAGKDFDELIFLSFFHDIGAYKFDDLPNLLEFEATNTYRHCLYGYMFMKYFSPLTERAKSILYHHAHYNRGDMTKDYLFGLKIHLIDRIDVFMMNNNLKINDELYEEMKASLLKMSGTVFNPKDVDDMFILMANDDFFDDVYTKEWGELDECFINLDISIEIEYGMINMLVNTFDLYNENGYFHSKSTATISKILAEFCGLDKIKCEEMYLSGLCHDLGKVKIPISILEKPGKLNYKEMEIMKKHASYTKDLLTGFAEQNVIDMAYSHHEKLDGSGYPNGLKADQMSMEIRIIAVADIISALLCKRSYKEEYDTISIIKILDTLVELHKVDGVVVDVFKKNFHTIVDKIHELKKDGETIIGIAKEEYLSLINSGKWCD